MEIYNNTEKKQFEFEENGQTAVLEYNFYKNNIAFMHVKVPKSMEGRGIAGALTESAFQYAKEIDKKVMVYCAYVGSYVKRHPDFMKQLDSKLHQL